MICHLFAGYKKGIAMNKNSFSPYVRRATYSTILAPFSIEERIIFDYEMIYVSGGLCKITVNDTEYICKKNDVVFIRPDISHKFESVGDVNFEQPHIHFDVIYNDKSEMTPISFKSKKKMSCYELSLIQEDVLANVNVPTVFVPYDAEVFKKLFFELINLYNEKSYNYEFLCKAKMLELLNCILMQFENHNNNVSLDTENHIISIKSFIDNNFLSIITLESLSTQFLINKYTLMRRFKSMYNENIITYYRKLRGAYAKKLLRDTDLSVYNIAEKMNFTDIYSFSRFFKKYCGCSPTAYRNFSKKTKE